MASQQQQTVSPSIKMLILIVMSLTTTLYLVLLRWTRVVTTEKYITTTTVAVQEIIKLVLAIFVLLWQNKSIKKSFQMIKVEAIYRPVETLKMAVPSVVYAIQNNMTYIALSNLDVPIQQILYQLKIPATAFCSVFLLGKSLSYQQWTACFMVFAGLALLKYEPSVPATGDTSSSKDQIVWIGVTAVMVAVFCSAFAGVYFEKMVKGSETSLWVRNIQMYVWTITASLVGVFTTDYHNVMEKGFFYAYTPAVWLLLCVGAINGLIVSLVLKYADNIVKGFAAAVSIILSTIASYFLFDYNIGIGFILGGLVVCAAICLYGIPLPCLSSKWTTANSTKNLSGSTYDKLKSASVGSNEEINASSNA